MYSLQYDPRNC